jgi:hypothetical protein
MEKMRNAYKILVGKHERLVKLSAEGRIILK